MRRTLTIVLAAVFLLVLLLFSVTYTVRFTESAVLTTFGKAGENAITDPGLRWKLPYPIQAVTKYDTRLQWLQTRGQTVQTRDGRQFVAEAFCTWRVSDPLKFFQRFSNAGPTAVDHYRRAEEALRSSLASSLSAFGKFDMAQLFSPQEGQTKLPELEKAMLAQLASTSESGVSLAEYGIEAVDVGVGRIILPQATTKSVFERMVAERDRLVKEIESKGEADAVRITSNAETDARKITSFAEQRAQEIRARGEDEAKVYLAQMNRNPELAVFLQNLELVSSMSERPITMIMNTSAPGLALFNPGVLNGLSPGSIPTSNLPQLNEHLAGLLRGGDTARGDRGAGRSEKAPATAGGEGAR
ncbi:MAG: SPFH domain-containing protein [Planctomycetota bacterium]|nr:SPFH domain-containing protein [Planctomycetota bacterium]